MNKIQPIHSSNLWKRSRSSMGFNCIRSLQYSEWKRINVKRFVTAIRELKYTNHGSLPSYAWPGGYPVFYFDSDNNTLCPNCANKTGYSTYPTAYDVNYEDDSLYCDDCSLRIESAYAEPGPETKSRVFKDYEYSIPDEFKESEWMDISNHNDICASLERKEPNQFGHIIQVFVNYPDMSDRDEGLTKRFAVFIYDSGTVCNWMEADSMDELNNAIGTLESVKYPGNDTQHYNFIIDMEERGILAFHVESASEPNKTVFEYRYDESDIEDEASHFHESSIFDDGYMKDLSDMEGLTEYLISLEIIPAESVIHPE